MFRRMAVVVACGILVGSMVASPAEARKKKVETNRLVDSDEYKDEDFEEGIIEDYEDMVEGDGVEWVYLAPGVKLSNYKVKIGKFKNMSEVSSRKLVESLEEGFDEAFDRAGMKGGSGTLTTTNAVYWAERASEGKRWIPYAGGHLAQAGVGVEMIFKDSSGKVVAKIRHSGRQGDSPEDAAEEVVDELASFIAEH